MALAIFFLFLLGSLALRVHNRRHREPHNIPDNARPSPLADALKDLVGTAGGIYLSLVLLGSFLRLDVPERILFYNINMDPLALAALLISIIQPLYLRIYQSAIGGV
jgi:hypothetical protein